MRRNEAEEVAKQSRERVIRRRKESEEERRRRECFIKSITIYYLSSRLDRVKRVKSLQEGEAATRSCEKQRCEIEQQPNEEEERVILLLSGSNNNNILPLRVD
jgi:hypothetical protein